MSQWLYNSNGNPIAFINGGDKVFSRRGHFVGRIDGNEVWHGRYKGEIVRDDMFLYKQSNSSNIVIRGTSGIPGTPGIPGIPGSRGSSGLPSGYDDVELED